MNKLLYTSEHLSCINYEHGTGASISEEKIEKGNYLQIVSQVNKIVVVVENTVTISSDVIKRLRVEKDFMFFLPAGSRMHLSGVDTSVNVLIFKLFDKVHLCDSFPLEKLFKKKLSKDISNREGVQHLSLLKLNRVAESFVSLTLSCHRAGLRCCNYNKSKVGELLFILRAFYPKQELSHFFHSVINADTSFTQLIMNNHLSCRSVSELASKAGYTVSGFEKKFRKIFNESPYRWMTKNRQREIYHYINSTSLNINQISDKLGFSSPSVFNDYVKRVFGKSPGQLRISGNKE